MSRHVTAVGRIILPVLTLAAAQTAGAQIDLIGTASIAGNAVDFSGLTGTYTNAANISIPKNQLGSFGSGIAYAGVGNRYVAANDRGYGDGLVDYADRFHVFDIAVDPLAAPASRVRPVLRSTHFLTNETGAVFTGKASAFTGADPTQNLRLDPEGIRVGRTGNLLISDEYGPVIYEFTPEGKRIRALSIPQKFLIPNPSAGSELPPVNTTGRQSNRGMEGLAISPDGNTLYGAMQNALIQDGALNANNGRIGLNNRILVYDLKTNTSKEVLYQIEKASTGVNEIVAINDHEFLVVERDATLGAAASFKKIYKVDITGATDISGIAKLPTSGTPGGVKAVKKSLFLDLLDPAFGLAGANFPEKIEGLSFGPDLADGRHLLLVTSDNDNISTQPTYFYAFGIAPSALPGYAPQIIVPEPGVTALLTGFALTGVLVALRRKRNRG